MQLTPSFGDAPSRHFTERQILDVILAAIRNTNLARDPSSQLTVSSDAELFGPGSPLDSLGLVALLLDIEEDLQDIGCRVVLSDDRAMSQRRSPFRSVASLVEYVSNAAR